MQQGVFELHHFSRCTGTPGACRLKESAEKAKKRKQRKSENSEKGTARGRFLFASFHTQAFFSNTVFFICRSFSFAAPAPCTGLLSYSGPDPFFTDLLSYPGPDPFFTDLLIF